MHAAERLAKLALDRLVAPPEGDEPVVVHRSPHELTEEFAAVIGDGLDVGSRADVDELVAAAELVIARSVQTSHPRFMNQNFAGPDPVAVVGDWLAAVLNTTNATFEAAPVFTMMERSVLRSLASLVGYDLDASPDALAPGMFVPGGSMATLLALQLARVRAQPDIVRVGADSTRLVIYVSDSGHYAAVKSAMLLGIGADAVVKVPSDPSGVMHTDALDRLVHQSISEGRRPLAVIATAGTTVTSAFDPVDQIADVCEAHSMWLHIDGCYGGSALFSPAERHRLVGSDRSDSMVWNLHKMMGMTQQCSALLIKDPTQLDQCFATGAGYIFQPDKLHGSYDAGDRTFLCGRRVDVLKLWLSWKHQGDEGFAARVDHAVAMADHARKRIDASDGVLHAIVPGDFTNVCFVWVPPEMRPLALDDVDADDIARLHQLAPRVKAAMLSEGSGMVGFQPVADVNAFRLLVMNPRVTAEDIDAVIDAIIGHAEASWPTLAP